MNDSYPINWVRAACQHIYGSPIDDRTWRKWQRICKVKPRTNDIDKEHSQWLMALAYKKREKPKGGRSSKFTVLDCIALLKSNPELIANLNKQMGDRIYSEGLNGEQLPRFIQQATGRKISLRQVYRWAKKHKVAFHCGEPVPRESVDKLIKIASR